MEICTLDITLRLKALSMPLIATQMGRTLVGFCFGSVTESTMMTINQGFPIQNLTKSRIRCVTLMVLRINCVQRVSICWHSDSMGIRIKLH